LANRKQLSTAYFNTGTGLAFSNRIESTVNIDYHVTDKATVSGVVR